LHNEKHPAIPAGIGISRISIVQYLNRTPENENWIFLNRTGSGLVGITSNTIADIPRLLISDPNKPKWPVLLL